MWPCIVQNFLVLKPNRRTNLSNLFLEWNFTCFGQFLCPSSGVFHCTHSNGICHTGLLTACEQDQDVPSWSCSQAVSQLVWHILLLCVQWKTPDDGQGNCPKHVEFHSRNKFVKLVHLVGFSTRKYHANYKVLVASNKKLVCGEKCRSVCVVRLWSRIGKWVGGGSDSNRGQYCALLQPWRRDQSSQQSTATYARFHRKKNKMREVYNAGTILLHVFFVDAPPPHPRP